jgi:hypothetical protein
MVPKGGKVKSFMTTFRLFIMRLLIKEHRAVEGIALDGLKTRVADDATKFFFSGAVACACGFDNILFEHD